VIEIHRTNNPNLKDNKFRLRIEKYINTSKQQTCKIYEEFSNAKEKTIIKNLYDKDGFYIFKIFKKYISHHYSNEKYYECNLNLPVGDYGSKMLQMVYLLVFNNLLKFIF
jgi:hypothetical protein